MRILVAPGSADTLPAMPSVHELADATQLFTIRLLLSPAYICQESPNCFKLLRQVIDCALSLARANAGRRSPARMAMIAITTRSSMSVKPEDWRRPDVPEWGRVLSI